MGKLIHLPLLQRASFNITSFTKRVLINVCKQLSYPLLLLALLCIPIYSNAHPPIEIQPNTFAILQDDQDFVWTAGHDGLTRHDNHQNITFSSKNINWPLPFDWIHSISLLKNNKLLLATENNKLWKFDTTTGKSSAIEVDVHQKSISLAVEYSSAYFLNVPNKLYRYSLANNETTIIADNIEIKDIKVTTSNLYASTKNGVFKLVNNKLEKIISAKITSIGATDKSLVVASEEKLFIINDDGLQKTIPINELVYAITPESGIGKDNIYTISQSGQIRKYSIKTGNQLSHSYPNSQAIYTRAMIQDSSGVLWILTNQGVLKLSATFFKNHKKIFDVAINGIALANLNDNLIIGSYGMGLSSNVSNHPILSEEINKSFTPKALIITDLLPYKNNLYIATFDGLWRYDAKRNNVSRVKFPDNNKLLLNISNKGKLLYLATNENGSYIYDIDSNQIIKHIKNQGLKNEESIDILPLKNSSVWIGKTTDIEVYTPFSDKVIKIKTPSRNKVMSLVEYKNKVFVATKGDGIYVYNQQGDLLSHMAATISFTYVTLINDVIWATAEPGLYKINPDNNQITLEPNTEHFTFTSVPIKMNNTVYIGHYGGILELPLLDGKRFNSKVYVSKVRVSGKNHLLNKTIDVQSSHDVITLNLTSLDFRAGQDKQYKYQINNGLWHQVNGNSLTLTGLASGKYNIEIMATNSLGQWSNNRAYTEINVEYPWYWTPQIRLIYALLIIGFISIVFWLLYLRTKSISHIHQLLKLDLKNREKTALNVRRNINLAVEIIHKDIDKTKRILKQSVDELNKTEINNAPDGLYGKSLLTTLPFFSEYVYKKHHVSMKNQIEINESNLSYEMQADLYKIIYEAITSAIINSNGRNFKVALQEFKGKLWLTINDDSNSFSNYNNKIDFDIAMYTIRQIATKYKASINTFDEQGSGSQLVISIPLKHY